jgi:hypothetical protein
MKKTLLLMPLASSAVTLQAQVSSTPQLQLAMVGGLGLRQVIVTYGVERLKSLQTLAGGARVRHYSRIARVAAGVRSPPMPRLISWPLPQRAVVQPLAEPENEGATHPTGAPRGLSSFNSATVACP